METSICLSSEGWGIGRQIAFTLAGRAKVAVNNFYEDQANAVADEIKLALASAWPVAEKKRKRE